MNPAQYCLIRDIDAYREQDKHGVIVLTHNQLEIFKTVPRALRMFLKHKYKLTTEAFKAHILSERITV